MCAYDYTAGKIWFGRNGVWINGGDPSQGLNPAQSIRFQGFRAAGMIDGTATSKSMFTGHFAASDMYFAIPAGFDVI